MPSETACGTPGLFGKIQSLEANKSQLEAELAAPGALAEELEALHAGT